MINTTLYNEIWSNPLPLHPDDFQIARMYANGSIIEIDVVQTLVKDAVFTTEHGWNKNPIDKTYAKIVRSRDDETWEDIEEEYDKDEYPAFGGPFTDAKTPWEWLKIYYYPPKRK